MSSINTLFVLSVQKIVMINYKTMSKIDRNESNVFLQLFANAMVGAGLVQDPNILLTSMNDLLVKALDKH